MKQEFLYTAYIVILIAAGVYIYNNIPIQEGFKKKKKKKSKDPLKQIGDIFKIFSKIERFFKYLGKFFKWLGEMIQCSVETVFNLPDCIIFYVIDLIIGVIGLIIKFLCSFASPLEKARLTIWDLMKWLDKKISDFTGFHIIEWPRSVIKKCYKCKNVKMPKL
jgi:hypothetical protein